MKRWGENQDNKQERLTHGTQVSRETDKDRKWKAKKTHEDVIYKIKPKPGQLIIIWSSWSSKEGYSSAVEEAINIYIRQCHMFEHPAHEKERK